MEAIHWQEVTIDSFQETSSPHGVTCSAEQSGLSMMTAPRVQLLFNHYLFCSSSSGGEDFFFLFPLCSCLSFLAFASVSYFFFAYLFICPGFISLCVGRTQNPENIAFASSSCHRIYVNLLSMKSHQSEFG